jgi:cytoskeletal protein RodZ
MEPKIGRILEQAREERGISLHQAEQATKIRARYLQELERENFDVLPPVYVQGSLRTYADYLGLDAEALVRELKLRQTPRDEPQGPVHGGSPGGGSAGSPALAVGATAGAAAAESPRTTEEKGFVAPTLRPVGNNGLYLASAALLVIILAVVAYVSTLAANGQPPVSHLRDPMASQEYQLAYQPRSASGGRNEGGESESRTPEQGAKSPDENAEGGAGQKERTGDDQDGPDGSQDSAAASTPQPSPATARSTATPVSPAPSTAAPAATRPEPEPTGSASSDPAAREPDGGSPGRRVVTIRRPSSGGPAAVGGSSLPGRRMIVVRPRPLAR